MAALPSVVGTGGGALLAHHQLRLRRGSMGSTFTAYSAKKKLTVVAEKALALTLTPHSNGYFRVAETGPALYPQ